MSRRLTCPIHLRPKATQALSARKFLEPCRTRASGIRQKSERYRWLRLRRDIVAAPKAVSDIGRLVRKAASQRTRAVPHAGNGIGQKSGHEGAEGGRPAELEPCRRAGIGQKSGKKNTGSRPMAIITTPTHSTGCCSVARCRRRRKSRTGKSPRGTTGGLGKQNGAARGRRPNPAPAAIPAASG